MEFSISSQKIFWYNELSFSIHFLTTTKVGIFVRISKPLFSFVTTALLFLSTASIIRAEVCPVASYDPSTSGVTLPCVLAGQQRLSLKLDYVRPETVGGTADGYYWALNPNFDLSSCEVVGGDCALFNENLDLMIPVEGVIEAGVKHAVTLKLAGDFYWKLAEQRLIDPTNTVTLRQGTPNPNGAFEKIYVLDGNFADNFDKLKDVMLLDQGVTLPVPVLKTGEQITLRIFHFNDLHNELRSVSKTKGDTHYFSQMVKIVKEARAKAAPNEIVLFVSAGDDHIGNPFDELMGYEVDTFQIDAAYHAYSAAGLDAATIGNHELDRGSALLAKEIETDAKFPVLSANLYGSKNLTAKDYQPAIIAVAKGLRIGIIGLTTQQEILLKSIEDPTMDVGDLLKTLETTLSYVEPLADVIILLTHVGYNGEVEGQPSRHDLAVGDIQIAETAAKMTTKPVMVIGGHMHLKLNETGLSTVDHSVPILEAGAKGSQLGEATFSLLQSEEGLRAQLTARLIPLKKRDNRVPTEDPTYNNYEHDSDIDLDFENTVMAPLYAKLDQKLQEVIGQAGNSEDLTTTKTYADRYLGETVIANFMNDAIATQSVHFPPKDGNSQQVDIAAFNASGLNGGVTPNSDITFNDWYSVMPYADMIVVTPMTGAQIKDLLMSNAQRLVRPEELTGPTPPDLTSYISRGFLHFSKELRYTIKLNRDATTAVAQDITLKGQSIETVLDQTFNVALGDYVALRGGEGWNGAKVGAGLPDAVIGFNLATLPKNDTGLVYRNEILDFIRKNGVVDESTGAVKDGRLQIVP